MKGFSMNAQPVSTVPTSWEPDMSMTFMPG